MTLFIIIFGVSTFIAGMIIIINPGIIFGLLRKYFEKVGMQITSIVLRLLFGAFLIFQSGISKFPIVIEILGWLAIAAAVVFALMGRNNWNRLMSWALSFEKPFGRVAGLIAACFGAFIIYAFI